MKDLFQTKGTLIASIGEGYLSSFELGALAPGDVVRTRKLAGYPATLLYNGTPIACCEVVVLDDILGLRVCTMEWPSSPAPVPGLRDDIVELLPTVVSLGSIQVSLAELRGVARNSIISLGRPFSEAEDAELLVAGMPVAVGKVVVLGEEFGLRITRVLTPRWQDETIRSTGFVLSAAGAPAHTKDYDFKRPDVFSRSQITHIYALHGSFMQNLAARFPALAGATKGELAVAAVDQMTYGEACEYIAKEAGKCRRLVAENLVGRQRPPDSAPQRTLMEEERTAHPVSAASRAAVEKFSAEAGILRRNPVLLYSRGWERRPDDDEALVACVRGAWKNVADMDIRIASSGAAQEEVGIPEDDMVIIVCLSRGKEPFLYLVYPYLTLEPFVGLLG